MMPRLRRVFWMAGVAAGLALAGPAHAMFPVEDIQRGLTEEDALRVLKNRKLSVEKLKDGEAGYVVRRDNGGDVRGLVWTCNGRVHAASAVQEGGIYAYIDRVADMTKVHGRGEVAAQIKPIQGGTTRTMEAYFKAPGDAIVKLSYTPAGSGRVEALWMQSSVPSVCAAK
jgi:hypothetical protein